mmetsp:Transcript_57652/g.122632  ORF Transcript_57652/g.122632 Transcript_57652/m.122632 type:complete len:177 (-) Transcript_57652:538-1068(-)
MRHDPQRADYKGSPVKLLKVFLGLYKLTEEGGKRSQYPDGYHENGLAPRSERAKHGPSQVNHANEKHSEHARKWCLTLKLGFISGGRRSMDGPLGHKCVCTAPDPIGAAFPWTKAAESRAAAAAPCRFFSRRILAWIFWSSSSVWLSWQRPHWDPKRQGSAHFPAIQRTCMRHGMH